MAMANRCAGLDPTWAHRPTPAPSHAAAAHYCSSSSSPAWLLTPAAAFENDALTSALRASMATMPSSHAQAAAPSSSSSPPTPSSSASELLSSGHDAPAPAPARRRDLAPGPKGGRVAKRRARPSRRAQTTYITADPADFRRMVQEVTGLPAAGPSPSSSFPAASEAAAATGAAPASWMPACVLPTLDTSAFLLDRPAAPPAAPEGRSASGGCATDAAGVAAAGDDDPSSVLLELEALVCAPAGGCGFPTLESWGII